MSRASVSQFDESLHLTNVWLKDIMDQLGWTDRRAAYSALRAALHALRDRLTVEEGAHLSAQLPLILKGVFYDGWKPSRCGGNIRSVREFLAPVIAIFGADPEKDEDAIARAVFATLRKHISAGEFDHVLHALPEPLRPLLEPA